MSQRKMVSETTLKMILRWIEVDEKKVWDEPAGGEVIVEEGDGDGEDDEVGNEQQEHADVPIKS